MRIRTATILAAMIALGMSVACKPAESELKGPIGQNPNEILAAGTTQTLGSTVGPTLEGPMATNFGINSGGSPTPAMPANAVSVLEPAAYTSPDNSDILGSGGDIFQQLRDGFNADLDGANQATAATAGFNNVKNNWGDNSVYTNMAQGTSGNNGQVWDIQSGGYISAQDYNRFYPSSNGSVNAQSSYQPVNSYPSQSYYPQGQYNGGGAPSGIQLNPGETFVGFTN